MAVFWQVSTQEFHLKIKESWRWQSKDLVTWHFCLMFQASFKQSFNKGKPQKESVVFNFYEFFFNNLSRVYQPNQVQRSDLGTRLNQL